MRAGEKPAYALVPPYMPDYPSTAKMRFRDMPMAARIEKAKALLNEAGFGPGNPLHFEYNIEDQSDARLIAVALQAMWKDVGANVEIVPADQKDHYNLMRRQNFSVAWAGWVADYRDPKDYLFLCQSSTKELNYGCYSSPKFDSFMDRADHAVDPAARAQLLLAAEQTMLDDVALAPVFFGVSRDLVSPSVKGWMPPRPAAKPWAMAPRLWAMRSRSCTVSTSWRRPMRAWCWSICMPPTSESCTRA